MRERVTCKICRTESLSTLFCVNFKVHGKYNNNEIDKWYIQKQIRDTSIVQTLRHSIWVEERKVNKYTSDNAEKILDMLGPLLQLIGGRDLLNELIRTERSEYMTFGKFASCQDRLENMRHGNYALLCVDNEIRTIDQRFYSDCRRSGINKNVGFVFSGKQERVRLPICIMRTVSTKL